MEEFKEIPNFPGYSVSKDGRIINSRKWELCISSNKGYRQARLKRADGQFKNVLLHRVVVETFLGPIPAGHWVNHKNGDKSDNRLENLEIGTPKFNHEHARDVLKRKWSQGENHTRAAMTHLTIEAIRALAKLGWTQAHLAEVFLVSQPTIQHIVSGKTWKEKESLL